MSSGRRDFCIGAEVGESLAQNANREIGVPRLGHGLNRFGEKAVASDEWLVARNAPKVS